MNTKKLLKKIFFSKTVDIQASKEKRFAKHLKYILKHQSVIVEIEE